MSLETDRLATHRPLGTHWHQYVRSLALFVAGTFGLGMLFAPLAMASGQPTIESLMASAKDEMVVGFGGEGTVEAKVDPEGLETTYETWLECASCGAGYDRVEGSMPAVSEVRAVTFVLHGLQLGGKYWVAMRVRNSAGEAFQHNEFEVPESPDSFPDGTAPVGVVEAPYVGDSTGELIAIAEREAKERSERELKEQEARELWEQVPASAQAGAQKEEAKAATPVRQRDLACVVPWLKGDTLSAADRALGKAHCLLGKISRPRHHNRTLFVTRQNPRPGRTLRASGRVTLTLGAKAR
jgi:hypothetical protein